MVVTRRDSDRFGLTTYGKTYADGPFVFLLRAELMARNFDIVHVHSLDRVVPWLKRLYGGRPVVMHYHGTDILGRWEEKRGRWRRADFIAYSTPNLSEGAPAEAVHLPNPVDTDLFHTGSQKTPRSALTIRYGMDEEARKVAAEKSLDLTLVDRGSVPYADMASLLSKFEYYLDLRRPMGFDEPVKSLGKAALEALACGCKVVDWSGRVLEGLPGENRPEAVAARWHSVYEALVRGGAARN
ncbi:MAG: glycosyltransferase [Candidatus Gagatemarchaeaceae archaeon]